MSNLQLPPIELLARAAKELSQAAREAGDKRNETALNNAIFDLHSGSCPVPTCGGFLVRSSSRNVAYRVDNVAGCNCDAGAHGKPCRHQAQIEIIQEAQRHTLPSISQRISAARAKFQMDELFA